MLESVERSSRRVLPPKLLELILREASWLGPENSMWTLLQIKFKVLAMISFLGHLLVITSITGSRLLMFPHLPGPANLSHKRACW